MKYSIIVVTYKDRFEEYFKPVINTIKSMRSDIEVIVEINGNYDARFDESYRKNILQFISMYDNIYPQMYTRFTSLAKLWNRGIQNSSNDLCLVLNDDVQIFNGFFDFIESNLDDVKYFTINNIFSHFMISRSYINDKNWFDERFLGIGWEDTQFVKQVESKNNINTNKIQSFHNKTNVDRSVKTADVNNKYSKFNRDLYDKIDDLNCPLQYPHYDFTIKNYKNLK